MKSTDPALSGARWRKASLGDAGGSVEVGRMGEQFLLRDSKDPDGPVLVFTPHEWDCFVAGAKDGEFDQR